LYGWILNHYKTEKEQLLMKTFRITMLGILFSGVVYFIATSDRVIASPTQAGASLYDSKCAACHAKDGSGNTPAGKGLKVKDLRSEDVQKQSDDELFDIIMKGKDKMPGYEKSLGHEKIHELVTYIRGLGKKS
jgi:mono/diheme cytochrome c family protein